jgi:hypothetical protein
LSFAPQIMHVIVVEKRALKMPGWAPAGYAELASRCLSYDACLRPSFEEAAAAIAALRAALPAA